ncbi:MAG TPA: conserved phage C-terminal domain-containing protein, partial [Rhizobacter sp.]
EVKPGKEPLPPIVPQPLGPGSSKAEAEGVLAYLNQRAERDYRPVESNLKFVRARLEEGATVRELRAVVDMKVRQWGQDPKMAEYLRPQTLFNATKFAQYVGQLNARMPVDERGADSFLATFEGGYNAGPEDDGMTIDMEESHA